MCTVISHRGVWSAPENCNTLAALEASFALGYGAETDVRDALGTLVVSHDPPRGDEVRLSDVLDAHARTVTGPLAINVKSDGLQRQLADALEAAHSSDYFVFDMSIPDALGYARAGLRMFSRQSEHEPQPALYESSAGVWIDSFDGDWFGEALLEGHLAAGKQVCLVSPELHGREHLATWARWATWGAIASRDVLVCTDHPVRAHEILGSG